MRPPYCFLLIGLLLLCSTQTIAFAQSGTYMGAGLGTGFAGMSAALIRQFPNLCEATGNLKQTMCLTGTVRSSERIS